MVESEHSIESIEDVIEDEGQAESESKGPVAPKRLEGGSFPSMGNVGSN